MNGLMTQKRGVQRYGRCGRCGLCFLSSYVPFRCDVFNFMNERNSTVGREFVRVVLSVGIQASFCTPPYFAWTLARYASFFFSWMQKTKEKTSDKWHTVLVLA